MPHKIWSFLNNFRINTPSQLQLTLIVIAAISSTISSLDAAPTLKILDKNNSIIDENKNISVNSKFNLPSFIWLKPNQFDSINRQSLGPTSKAILSQLRSIYRFSKEALAAIKVSHIHDTGSGAIIVQLSQQFHGLELLQHRISIVYNRRLQPISISGFLSPTVPDVVTYNSLQMARQSLSTAIKDFTGKQIPASTWQQDNTILISPSKNHQSKSRLNKASHTMHLPLDIERYQNLLSTPAKTKLAWLLMPSGIPILVTEIEIEIANNTTVSKMNRYLISAQQKIVSKNSLTSNASKTYTVWADESGEQLPYAGPQGNSQFPHPTGEDDDTLINIISPSTVTLDSSNFSAMDPWLSASQTTTQGNNVNAYVDISLPDGFTPFSLDHQASETSVGRFDYNYNFSADPNIDNSLQNAAIVQAFYVTNFIHDWLYDSGFDESAGNGQSNNFGRGGNENDAMLVEVQDFEERNNANMTTPSDGTPPRMQIFLWDGETSHQLDIAPPSPLSGSYETGAASFGPTEFDLSEQLVLVDDGVVDPAETDSTIHDACEDPILNAADLNGKIAVIDRGVCFFVEKVDRVEALGALAVVIINQKTDGVITMGSGENPPQIDIPTLMISKTDGDPLRSALLNGDVVTIRMTRTTSVDRNAGLDTSLIAHEWGHFLTNRLVQINSTQSQGLDEGWSDFLALLFLTRNEDVANLNGAFSISSFANNSKNALYFGIRRLPYSVDMTLNALTFKHIANGQALPSTNPISFGSDGSDNAQVHATGEVWATMLWEGYVNLINDPRHSFSEAQTRMKNYLVASLKATPVDPSFIEARDALLSVVAANDAADQQIFIDAFARRGLGVGAISPAKNSETNANPVESFITETVQPPAPPPPAASSGGGGSVNYLLFLLVALRLGVRKRLDFGG